MVILTGCLSGSSWTCPTSYRSGDCFKPYRGLFSLHTCFLSQTLWLLGCDMYTSSSESPCKNAVLTTHYSYSSHTEGPILNDTDTSVHVCAYSFDIHTICLCIFLSRINVKRLYLVIHSCLPSMQKIHKRHYVQTMPLWCPLLTWLTEFRSRGWVGPLL